MSTLIKGLKMPKGDKALVVDINSNGTVDRPNWQWDCTLIKGAEAVELPDHGDLLDKDELSRLVGESFEYFLARLGLRCPKAVIPAERSESDARPEI